MKALLRTTLLFFSFSLVAETTIIERLLDTTESNASQENEDIFVFDDTKNNKESKIEKIINFFDDPENLFVTGTATIGALQILDYINVLAHEYGHALPAIATGRGYEVEIKHSGGLIFPFEGQCLSGSKYRFATILLGPVAGVYATYLQCAIIKALYDSHISHKSFAECYQQAKRFPITFFNNAVNTGEKYCSAYINSKSMLSTEKKPSSFIINTLLFFRTLGMIAESIYGFLPYEQSTTINDTEVKGDGEKLWQILLGSQPPTFKINLYAAAIGVMSAPLIIGVMKGLYKELRRLKSEISNPPLSTANRPPTFCSSKRPH